MNISRNELQKVHEKKLRWYGSMKRMKDGRMDKEILAWEDEGRRKKGRPRISGKLASSTVTN